LMGPETYDNLGNESYITANRLVKSTGIEHLTDSNISDNGTTVTILSNAVVNGTFSATGTTLVSGSVQVDVMSTTNIARLATTGSNTFSGNILISKTGTTSVELNSTTATSYSAFFHSENGTPKAYWEYINSSFSDSSRRNYLEAYNGVGGFSVYTAGSKTLDMSTTGAATFSSTVRTGGVSIGVASTANVLDVRGENNTYDGTIILGARGAIQHRDADQTILSIANDYNSDLAKMEFRMKGNTSADSKLTILGSGVATFANTINVNRDINIGDYTTNTTLTFQSVSNGTSRINFYDANNTEGVYVRNIGTTYGGDLRFGARWDDDEDKVFFTLRQSSAGATFDARFGLNVDPTETFHVSSNGITASAPSKGWPVYDAELDTNARRFIFQTAGNNNVGTAGQGASAALILGQYFDSRVIITTPGAGSSSPSDQGTGRGRDMMIKAGAADNTVGYSGGRLYLNGGIGYGAGGFNANGGHVIMQSLTGSGNVGINDTNPQTKLSINGANYIEMATFACTTAASSTIVTDNSGYVQFSNDTARHLSNSSVFNSVTDGIRILKAGIVQVTVSQDIKTAGTTGYALLYIQKNKSTVSENLITNTNDEWDGINGVATIAVAADDVINFYYSAANITSLDANTWSNYSFIWSSR